MDDEELVRDSRQWSTNTAKAHGSFVEAGIRMRTGAWSVEEKLLVQKNVDRFIAKHRGLTVEDVVFSWTKADRKGFYKKAAKGIRRPLNSIYTYMKRRYHPYNYLGTYSKEEEARLWRLYEKYGAKWTKIGRKMKRSPETVAMKFRSMDEKQKVVDSHGEVKVGVWSEEENRVLKDAVHEFRQSDSVDSPVVWDSVARRIPGKTAKQCRQRWTNYLSLKSLDKQWKVADDIMLVNVLYGTSDILEGEIPWDDLHREHWPDWPVSALKSFWQRLRTNVPGRASLVLDDVLVWLYDNHLPKLEASVQHVQDNNKDSDDE